jgi:hypothetical protein
MLDKEAPMKKKTLLRTFALAAALSLSVALAGRAVITPPLNPNQGICHTTCVSDTGFTKTALIWQTSESECCSTTLKPPCPVGTHELYSAYQPPNGFTSLCQID